LGGDVGLICDPPTDGTDGKDPEETWKPAKQVNGTGSFPDDKLKNLANYALGS
jgi:hypothetical protein